MDIDPTTAKQAAGPLGAFSAMLLMRNVPWILRISIFLPGAACAYYASSFIARWAGIPEGLSGFAIGFFAPAIGKKILDTIERLDLSSLVRRWIEK
jgi:hypothetical protein